MARIRSIKPAFFVNEQLAELSYGDRLLFIGLWTQADKCGRLEDRPMRLKAALFPYDDFNVVDGLGRLANAGLIVRYEGNGQRLIQIPTWEKHQRPHKSEQDSELPPVEQKDGELPVGQRLEALKEAGSGGFKGTESLTTLRSGFDWFWMCYPRKVGKDAAWAVWQRLKPNDELVNAMIAAIDKQSRSPQWLKESGQYIPHPRTWLGQGRWSDEETAPLAIVMKGVPVAVDRRQAEAEQQSVETKRRRAEMLAQGMPLEEIEAIFWREYEERKGLAS